MKLINDSCMNVEIPYAECNDPTGSIRNIDKGKADILTFGILDFLNHIYESADVFMIFCGIKQFPIIYEYFEKKKELGKGSVRQYVYCKSNPSPMNGQYVYLSAIENAVWFKKKGTGELNFKCQPNYTIKSSGSSEFHPTEKNHDLLKEIILQNTSVGDLIVDTCMGSGSTGVVARKHDRDFFGIELDKKFYDRAEERLNLTGRQKLLF